MRRSFVPRKMVGSQNCGIHGERSGGLPLSRKTPEHLRSLPPRDAFPVESEPPPQQQSPTKSLETGSGNPQFFQHELSEPLAARPVGMKLQKPAKNKSHPYGSALSGAAGPAGSEPVPLQVKLTVLQIPPAEKQSQPHLSHRSRAKANHRAHASIRTR